MKDTVKKIYRILKRRDFWYTPDIRCHNKFIGSDYGGWWLADTDFMPDDIVLSFGLGEDISFDLGIIENYGCKVYGFDPTPKSITYLKSLTLPSNFILKEFGLGAKDEMTDFFLPKNEEHVSGSVLAHEGQGTKVSVLLKSLKTLIEELKINKNIKILKMDVEGAEYNIIKSLFPLPIKIDQILIEYHHFFSNVSYEETINSIQFLKDNGYYLFKIDGYNYSFIRKDLITEH